MSIASIDRGIFTTVYVDVDVENRFIAIESGSNGIKLTRSEAEQLIQALRQSLKELPEETKYVVILPQKESEKLWNYIYLHHSGKIEHTDGVNHLCKEGAMTLDEIKAFSKHYEPFAIPVEEFRKSHSEDI